jgi:peptide/nickel transport system permease protein
VQYLKWISRVLQGDFGFTLEYQRPVSEVIGDRLALTIVVSVASLLVTWAVALPVGVYTAMRPRSVGYYLATGFTSLGLALPGFLLGLVVLFVGFVAFGLDVGGLFSADYVAAPWSVGRALDLLEHLPVPAVVLAVSGSAQAVRILRANLLDELHKPYVLSARARGLSELQTVIRHPLRVALVPFASMVGSTLPSIVSGSIIVSLVLGLPTVGPLLLKALIATDLYLAGAIVLLLGALTVVGTFLSDVLVMWLDPRVRPGSV